MIYLVVGSLLVGVAVYLAIAGASPGSGSHRVRKLGRSRGPHPRTLPHLYGVSWGDRELTVWERLPLYDHEERGDFR